MKCPGAHLKGSVTLMELILRVHELFKDRVLDASCLPDGKLLGCVVEGEDGQRHSCMQPNLLQQLGTVSKYRAHC